MQIIVQIINQMMLIQYFNFLTYSFIFFSFFIRFSNGARCYCRRSFSLPVVVGFYLNQDRRLVSWELRMMFVSPGSRP